MKRLNPLQERQLLNWLEGDGRALVEEHGPQSKKAAEAATEALGFEVGVSSIANCARLVGIKKIEKPDGSDLGRRVEWLEAVVKAQADALKAMAEGSEMLGQLAMTDLDNLMKSRPA